MNNPHAFTRGEMGTRRYTRELPIIGRAEVIVCGGGPAGIAASIQAARAGKKCVVIDKNGFLGGMWTASMVLVMAIMNDRRGNYVIKGIAHEFLDRLGKCGGVAGDPQRQIWNPIDPEKAKRVADAMVLESGAKLLFHSSIVDVVRDGDHLKAVVIANKEGLQVIEGDAFVDCTGDADLASFAGAPHFVEPRDSMQPMTCGMRLGGVQIPDVRNQLNDFPFKSFPAQMQHAFDEAVDKHGNPPGQSGFHVFALLQSDEYFMNKTRIMGDATKVADLTFAEVEARKQAFEILDWYREHIPGFDQAVLLQTGSQIGVRETRRLDGEYVLTGEDVLHCRKMEDAVARGHYFVDLHRPKDGETSYRLLPEGDYYSIPYRSLYSKKVPNLLVAGRCISGTHEAAGSYRVTSHCMATGQAAGAAVSLMLESDCKNHEVEVPKLQEELKASEALI